MAHIFSTGLLSCGLAIALLSPALAAEKAPNLKLAQATTCATQSGPVAEGTTAVDACINAAALVCPGNGAVFQCRGGLWYCQNKSNHGPPEPCGSDKSGAWTWNGNALEHAK
jgi:hypothetical protein